MAKPALRTFIAYVEDLPGVLNRVTSLLRRRNYNIVSLTVGRTERAGVSRMTVVVEADEDAARRIEANLYKLVNVLFVEDTSRAATMSRELALVKVRADAASRSEVMRLCDVFRARVVDVGQAEIDFAAVEQWDKGARPGHRLNAHLHLELVVQEFADNDAAGVEDRALWIAGDDAHLLRLRCSSDAASERRSSDEFCYSRHLVSP